MRCWKLFLKVLKIETHKIMSWQIDYTIQTSNLHTFLILSPPSAPPHTYIGTTLTSKFLHINTFYWLKVYRKPRLSHYSYLISINFSVNSIFLHDLENMMGQVIMQPPNLMLTNAKCLPYMIHPCKNSYLNPTYGNCFGQCM